MTVERAYRQDGLTIGGLAQRLDLPEYRLRRLINQGARLPQLQQLPEPLPDRGRQSGAGRPEPGRRSRPDHRHGCRLQLARTLQSGLQGRNRPDADRISAPEYGKSASRFRNRRAWFRTRREEIWPLTRFLPYLTGRAVHASFHCPSYRWPPRRSCCRPAAASTARPASPPASSATSSAPPPSCRGSSPRPSIARSIAPTVPPLRLPDEPQGRPRARRGDGELRRPAHQPRGLSRRAGLPGAARRPAGRGEPCRRDRPPRPAAADRRARARRRRPTRPCAPPSIAPSPRRAGRRPRARPRRSSWCATAGSSPSATPPATRSTPSSPAGRRPSRSPTP